MLAPGADATPGRPSLHLTQTTRRGPVRAGVHAVLQGPRCVASVELPPACGKPRLWCWAPSTPPRLKSGCDRMSAHSPDMKDTVAPLETRCRCYRWHASAPPHDRPPNATLLLIRPSATWLKQLISRQWGANSLWPLCVCILIRAAITCGPSG